MNLLMISGERGIVAGKKTPFWYTLSLLREHFTRIDVICPRTTSASPVLQPFENVCFHPSPWPLWLQPLWIKRKGEELHQQHHFDAMTVLEYPPFYNGIGAKLLFQKTHIPYAIEFHHGEPVRLSLRGKMERMLLRRFAAFDARDASLVRVVNPAVGETLMQWGVPRHKTKVVSSLYLDLQSFKSDPNIMKQYDVVFCSRLVAGKGFSELIEALRAIPQATLLVIGDGPKRASFASLVRDSGMSEQVTFKGWISSNTELANTLQTARMLVMNSWSEGNPRVAAEAMACGMPVIATKVGLMPQLIVSGENGLLIGLSVKELGDALQLLLQNAALRERMSHAAPAAVAAFGNSEGIATYATFLRSLSSSAS